MGQELNDVARRIIDANTYTRLRLYRATAAEHFVLVAGDRREPVAL